MQDTIAAISTPVGEGGIAVIRLSGPRATAIADQLFFSTSGRPSTFPTHTIHYGTLRENGSIVDQVLLSVMRAPRTYTREDMVEISCHGGILTARITLQLCLRCGARLADPGEFTQRAFLNGRLDLTQAEAVMDVIRARTDRAHSAAVHILEGQLSRCLSEQRELLITILAHLEAHIDFPEEGISPIGQENIERDLKRVLIGVKALLTTEDIGKILREGVPVAIVGRPNVGKSSLMNALLGRDRSIVTRVSGTTRDTIEELIAIGGIPVRLTDTAGIRNPRGMAEKAGVMRSLKALEDSALVLCVFDSSRPWSKADQQIFQRCTSEKTMLVLNKSDLRPRLTLPVEMKNADSVSVSAETGAGLDELRKRIESILWNGKSEVGRLEIAVNQRHATALRQAENTLTEAIVKLKSDSSTEIVAQLVRVALQDLGEITGQTVTDEILNKIFSTFCIGK